MQPTLTTWVESLASCLRKQPASKLMAMLCGGCSCAAADEAQLVAARRDGRLGDGARKRPPHRPRNAVGSHREPSADGYSAAVLTQQFGNELPEAPITLLRKGAYNKVPLTIGTNQNEGAIFTPVVPFIVPMLKFPITEAELREAMQHFFASADDVNAVMARYSASTYGTWDNATAVLLRHGR